MAIEYKIVEDNMIWIDGEEHSCQVALIYWNGLYTRYRLIKRLVDGLYFLQKRYQHGWLAINFDVDKEAMASKVRKELGNIYNVNLVELYQNGKVHIKQTVSRALLLYTNCEGHVELTTLVSLVNKGLYDEGHSRLTDKQVRSAMNSLVTESEDLIKLEKKDWYGWKVR